MLEKQRYRRLPERSPAGLLQYATAAALLCIALTSRAQENTGHHGGSAHGREFPVNTIGLFVGDTVEDRDGEERRDAFTIGLEFEHRATEHVGIGFTAERIGGDFDTNVFVTPIAWHQGPWKVYAGPGFEDGEEGNEALFRVGVEYGFHLGRVEVSPQVDVDFVDGEELFVMGVVLAIEL